MADAAELIVLQPRGPSAAAAREFLGRCLIYGVDFYFEAGDRLPTRLPGGVQDVRAVVFDETSEPVDARSLDRYRQAGARIYTLDAGLDVSRPNARRGWRVGHLVDMLAMDASLTLHHPRHIRKMQQRDDRRLFEDMGRRLREPGETGWYDATRYQWEGLLDGYEVTGDRDFLEALSERVEAALQLPNRLDNCDTVAPLLPLLRLYEHTGRSHLLRYAVEKADAYLRDTPRYRGCLSNFADFAHTARSEIIWQVCPSLACLAKVTHRPCYLEAALEQYDRLQALLGDERTGLWRHGVGDGQSTPGNWARGAAFVLLGLILLLEYTPADHSQHTLVHERIRQMGRALVRYQDAGGFWFTLIDHPESEFESSGTAWICAGLERGMRLGHLDHSYRAPADAAWGAVKSRIWRGEYPGHNTATTVSPSIGYYTKRQLSPSGWTHFAFRAACERRRAKQTDVPAQARGEETPPGCRGLQAQQ